MKKSIKGSASWQVASSSRPLPLYCNPNPVWHDRSAEVVSHDRENDNGFEDDDDDDSALQNVILKADSEIVLGTVVDSVAIDVRCRCVDHGCDGSGRWCSRLRVPR